MPTGGSMATHSCPAFFPRPTSTRHRKLYRLSFLPPTSSTTTWILFGTLPFVTSSAASSTSPGPQWSFACSLSIPDWSNWPRPSLPPPMSGSTPPRAWAKYTGAAEYDQELHRDYLNHTPLVPTSDPRFAQLEIFVWLSDVTEAHGPTHVVSRQLTNHLPAWPNWLSRSDVPEMYEAEVSAAGPAGTVLAYSPATFHRGTAMTAPRGARYSLHVNFRPAAAEWANRHGWADKASHPSGPDGTSSSSATRGLTSPLGEARPPGGGHPKRQS